MCVRLTEQPCSNHVADGLHRDGAPGTPKDVPKLFDGSEARRRSETRDFANDEIASANGICRRSDVVIGRGSEIVCHLDMARMGSCRLSRVSLGTAKDRTSKPVHST